MGYILLIFKNELKQLTKDSNEWSIKEVDIVPYSFVPTPDFSKQIDFSIPLGIEYYNLLQQWPKEESRLTAIIRPFSFEVRRDRMKI